MSRALGVAALLIHQRKRIHELDEIVMSQVRFINELKETRDRLIGDVNFLGTRVFDLSNFVQRYLREVHMGHAQDAQTGRDFNDLCNEAFSLLGESR